jgi:serine/threonine-protein kinase
LRIAAVAGATLLAGGVAVRTTRNIVAQRTRPARVALAITPWADITVDGVAQGRTPPLKTLELAPGQRTIALRHGSAPPLTLELDLKPGEQTTVSHSFGAPKPRPQQPANPVRSFFRGLGF